MKNNRKVFPSLVVELLWFELCGPSDPHCLHEGRLLCFLICQSAPVDYSWLPERGELISAHRHPIYAENAQKNQSIILLDMLNLPKVAFCRQMVSWLKLKLQSGKCRAILALKAKTIAARVLLGNRLFRVNLNNLTDMRFTEAYVLCGKLLSGNSKIIRLYHLNRKAGLLLTGLKNCSVGFSFFSWTRVESDHNSRFWDNKMRWPNFWAIHAIVDYYIWKMLSDQCDAKVQEDSSSGGQKCLYIKAIHQTVKIS